MSSYALDIEGQPGTRGPLSTPEEVAAALEEYRASHPGDPEFAHLHVWEMPPHATVGTERSVWDFIDRL